MPINELWLNDYFIDQDIIYKKMYHLKVCSSITFNIWRKLYKHHCHRIPNHFHHCQKKPQTLSINPHCHFPPTFNEPLICFLSLWSCLFQTFHLNKNNIICGFFWLTSLIKHVFKVISCYIECQSFVSFYCFRLFHCIAVSQLCNHSAIDEYFCSFHLLAIMNSVETTL